MSKRVLLSLFSIVFCLFGCQGSLSSFSLGSINNGSSSATGPSVYVSGPDNQYCALGDIGNFGAQTDGPASLPKTCVYTALLGSPSTNPAQLVTTSAALQIALNGAKCGDVIELQAGATFEGPFTFPAHDCNKNEWITVRTSSPNSSLPPEGTRMTPCYSGVSSLVGRPALNCKSTDTVTAKIISGGNYPLTFEAGANYYRLIGLEVTRPVGGYVNAIASINQADHIIFDRVWFHGDTNDETNRGIAISAGDTYIAVIDSYLNDFHCISVSGTCTDAQAIAGGGGDLSQGTYKFVNNFLEASGETILFGGGEATTTPTDIEIRRNHMFKPMNWMVGSPNFIGGTNGNAFIVKNNFELKNGIRVLFEGNILENVWGGYSQSGFQVLLTPKDQSNVCPLCQVSDVIIRYSTMSHSGGGMQIADALSDAGGAALRGSGYSIHDITIDDISKTKFFGGGGGLFQISNAFKVNPLSDVTINHITAFPDSTSTSFNIGGFLSDPNASPNPQMSNIQIKNSIITAGKYPVWSTGGGPTNCAYHDVPITTFTACFGEFAFAANAIIDPGTGYPPSAWPSGVLNYFPSAAASVNFINYNNGDGGDYRLSSTSPYKNKGTDGKDLGADINKINTAILGVN